MRAKSSKPADLLPRWRVYQIRQKAELIGSVHAKSADEAVERAVETYDIDEWRKKRLFARPTGETA
jgi:hypothetical protein